MLCTYAIIHVYVICYITQLPGLVCINHLVCDTISVYFVQNYCTTDFSKLQTGAGIFLQWNIMLNRKNEHYILLPLSKSVIYYFCLYFLKNVQLYNQAPTASGLRHMAMQQTYMYVFAPDTYKTI